MLIGLEGAKRRTEIDEWVSLRYRSITAMDGIDFEVCVDFNDGDEAEAKNQKSISKKSRGERARVCAVGSYHL
jgi:hypothetical protein